MGIRVRGIPPWVTIVAILLAILSTVQGLRSFIDPTVALGYSEGADRLALAWAGRNVGLGLALALAVFFRNSAAYAAAFIGSCFREFGDLLPLLVSDLRVPIPLYVLLLLDISAFALSLRAALTDQKIRP